MFLFKRTKKLINTGFFDGFIDFHSHILPGVDDGVKTQDEALNALEYFENLKVRKMIFTPHLMNGVGNDRESIIQSFDIFRKQYRGKIQLSLGAEYMLDSGFEQQFEKGLQCLYGDVVLVETSYLFAPNNFYEHLYNISVSGNTPVIAHPERYIYMNYADYRKLKHNESLFQLNLLSLTGYYGKQVKSNAEYLLRHGMYDIVGTDMHNLKTFKIWIEKLRVTKDQLDALMKIKAL